MYHIEEGTAALIASYSDHDLAFLVDHLTRSNALMLDEAVKMRHSPAAQGAGADTIELNATEIAVPLGTVAAGHLVFTTGATRLQLTGDAASDELFHAEFSRLAPSVVVQGGVVKVFYRQALLNWNANSANVQLNPHIPWHLELTSSGASCHADVRALTLRGIELQTKGSSIEVLLPQPKANIPIRIGGNASTVVLRRPADTPVQLRVQRGVAHVLLDGAPLDVTAGKPYQTPHLAEGAERYDIELAAQLTTLKLE